MNNANTQQPKKPYLPLMASMLMMMGLENRFRANIKGRNSGIPYPEKQLNQRQKRKLAAQTR